MYCWWTSGESTTCKLLIIVFADDQQDETLVLGLYILDKGKMMD